MRLEYIFLLEDRLDHGTIRGQLRQGGNKWWRHAGRFLEALDGGRHRVVAEELSGVRWPVL